MLLIMPQQRLGTAGETPSSPQTGPTMASCYPASRTPTTVAHDAPQLPAPVSDRASQVEMAMDYIQQYHVTGISWHTTLNNHASTRPKASGGKLVDSLTECKAFEQSPGSAPVSDSATWRCRLVLPNSFVRGDGRVLHATGEGGTGFTSKEEL